MDDDLVGTMMDAGMTPQDVREAFGSAYATTHDPGAPIEPVVHTLLTVARDEREPPGPQVVVPSGVVHSLPASKDAKPVRVDTEESYRQFRNGNGADMATIDMPENSQSIPDMLNELAEGEAGLSDTTDFQRGSAAQWLTGAGRKRRRRRGSRVGDIMSRGAASTNSLFNDPAFSGDQTCLFCGTPSGGTAACANCLTLPEVLGLFERGPASAIYDSNPTSRNVRLSTVLGDMYRMQRTNEESARMIGADNEFYRMQRTNEESARMIGNDEFYRLQHQLDEANVLGADAEEFYRLQRTNEESATMVGAEEFYRLQHQVDESAVLGSDDPFYRLQYQTEESARLIGAMYSLSRFADEADALTSPSDAPAEPIALSFTQPDVDEHVATWKQGDNLYGSMRIMGWDGRPRILTMATPFAEAVGCVVGYATKAGLPPAQTMAVVEPLARALGASQLVPRLAASSPGVLRTAHGQATPLVFATMPVTNHRVR